MIKKKIVSLVIPAFNEEGNLLELYAQIKEALQKNDQVTYEIIFVNDGSLDNTLGIIKGLAQIDKRIKIINFARNFGHEIAMTAGLDHSIGDAVIFMDADLQHPPALIPQMIEKWLGGCDVVLTKLIHNEDKTFLQSFLSSCFYKLIGVISDVKIPAKMPDFRLIGEKYIKVLREMRENSRMFRGMLNWLGMLNVAEIEFVAPKRFAGKTNYNLTQSFRLAIDSILQFSIKPLRISIYFSMICAAISLTFGAWTIFEHYALNRPSVGYASIVCLIVFLSSLQFVILGIIGEYIGRIHIESKNRPLYFAEVIENKTSE
ncbi:MAG: glycosyltransferase family 2 protein [Rickettsiales bacterium]|nr:glycosyltransferase family 2 protein [Rickettsiales bacterium]